MVCAVESYLFYSLVSKHNKIGYLQHQSVLSTFVLVDKAPYFTYPNAMNVFPETKSIGQKLSTNVDVAVLLKCLLYTKPKTALVDLPLLWR